MQLRWPRFAWLHHLRHLAAGLPETAMQPPPRASSPPQALSGFGQALRALDDDDEVYDPAVLVQRLTEALALQMARVIDLFREWDDDGNGLVSKVEFRRALPMLGLKVDRMIAEQLFDSFDEDRSGEISYDELQSKLRSAMMARAGIELDDALKAGAMGEIVLESKNKIALRTGPAENISAALGQTQIVTGEGAPPVVDQLRDALQKNLARVIDLFREWDDDGNGEVSKHEFRLALPMLGLGGVDKAMADELFDTFDRDGSGSVEYCEISRSLRPKPTGFLPKVKSAPQMIFGGGEEEYKVALAAQDAAKKRLVKMQKELLRAASTAALQQTKEDKLRVGRETRLATDAMMALDQKKMLAATPPASETEVRQLAAIFHKTLQTMFPGPAEQRLWYKLFVQMDEDKSGRITYNELSKMVRHYLAISRTDMPEMKLRALWRSLDEDASGYISAGEFGRFMKKGNENLTGAPNITSRQRLIAKRLVDSAAYKAELGALGIGRDVSHRTFDVPAASLDEVAALAEQMTTKMVSLYPGQARAWVKLFKYIDADSSGQIDYREFTKMCRDHLALSPKTLSEAKLQAVWKAVEEDASGHISLGAFGRFMKKGAKGQTKIVTDKSSEDEFARRRRLAKEQEEARKRQTEFAIDHKHHVAARQAAALTRQLEMESARLEAALRRKSVRGIDWRGVGASYLPNVGQTDGEGSAGAAMGAPVHSVARGASILPPVRIGVGVDF